MRLLNLAFSVAVLVAAAALGGGAGAGPQAHSVDYVIGMLEAGMTPEAIIGKIRKDGLVFRVEAGDLDRLRAAGAGDALVRAVGGEEEKPSRPRRLSGQAGGPAEEQETAHGGYPYYDPGAEGPRTRDFYPYAYFYWGPYDYSPFYSPYDYSFGWYDPFWYVPYPSHDYWGGGHYRRHGGEWIRPPSRGGAPAPRGHMAPRGGGGRHGAPPPPGRPRPRG